MKPNTLSIYEIFEKQKRYVVPLFQRPYVWTKDKQWEPLWTDILDQVRAAILKQKPLPHFLGAVVLDQRQVFGKDIAASDIIDGQQRLTTLQVFLAAFRDQVASLEKDVHAALGDLTTNRHHREQPLARFKVWPTNVDQALFEFIMTVGSKEALEAKHPVRVGRKKAHRPPLVEAYVYFYDAIANFLKGDGDGALPMEGTPTARVEALYEAVKDRLQMVVIELEEDKDNPQVIFETLNDRGEPLLPSDLVRNFMFLQADRQTLKMDDLYAQYWREYDERPAEDDTNGMVKFWKKTRRQGRLIRSRLDIFLQHYLACKTEKDINVTRTYMEFRNWWKAEKNRSVNEELAGLRRYSDVFAQLIVPDRESAIGVFARRLLQMDTSTLYPLLLFLLVEREGKITRDTLLGVIRDLESYLVRRMICGLTTKNYNHMFLGMLARLRKMETITREDIRNELLAGDGASVLWPDDGKLGGAWKLNDSYESLGHEKVALVLEAIDLELTTSKQEKVHLGSELTVEHFMPASWETNWPPPEPGKPGEMDSVDFRNQMIQTFGNLTLLTQPLNSSVSNGPFEKKKAAIVVQSNLRLNTYFQRVTQWNEMEIVQRSGELLAIACKIWPHPKSNEQRKAESTSR